MSQFRQQSQQEPNHVTFETTINVRDLPHQSYIKYEHLSTPPAHQRLKPQNLGSGRQFVNPSQVSPQIASRFPQINTSYSQTQYQTGPQPHHPSNFTYSNPLQQKPHKYSPHNEPRHTLSYQSQHEQVLSPQAIRKIYEQRKEEYLARIKRLEDFVEINLPDNGRYLGQVIEMKGQGSLSGRSGFQEKEKSVLGTIKNGQGIFFYPNGDVYFGGWKDQLFNGQGVYIFQTGQIYDGLLKDSLKHGRGTYYYQNSTAFYSGMWENDLKQGTGMLNTPEEYYQGQWKDGLKHGSGYYKNKFNKIVYVGEFVEGIKQGKGRMVYPDGSVYAGEFVNELPHGVGDFQYPNKDKYIGQFFEGKKHGKGNYFFSEGTIFSGLWKQDQKIQGELTLFNGDIFNGCFKNNQRYQGTYRYRNGDVYEGTWKDDVKQGFGKLYLQNGQKYQGQFVQGQKHGEGIYTWKNGDRFQGQFAYDKREGLGQYYWNDGGVYKGEWKADRMNGFGRLVKDGMDVIGEFFADHFERPIEEAELGALRNFVLG